MKNILPSIDLKRYTEKAGEYLQAHLAKAKKKNVVVAVSGGVDSATALLITRRTLSPRHVYPLLLPYSSKNSSVPLKNAQDLLDENGFTKKTIHTIFIENIVSSFSIDSHDSIRLGNSMARVRMTLIFDAAKRHDALVLGTENKSEHLFGYYTRFGDEASDIELIRGLYKTQVYQVASYLGVSDAILKSTPSAGLWPGQTDEKELGFSYAVADPILYLLFEKKYSVQKLVQMGFKKSDILSVKMRVQSYAFKHEVPYIFSYK